MKIESRGSAAIGLAACLMLQAAAHQQYKGARFSFQASNRNELRHVSFSRDGRSVYVGLSSGEFQTYDIARRKVVHSFTIGREGRAYGTGPKETVFTLHADGTVAKRDGRTGRVLATVVDRNNPVTGFLVSPEGTKLALLRTTGCTIVRDGGKALLLVPSGKTACFDPTGRFAAVGLSKEHRVYDLAIGKMVNSIPARTVDERPLALSPTGKFLAAGSRREGLVSICDVARRSWVRDMADTGGCVAASFSRDGRYLVAGLSAGTASLFDVATGKPVGDFEGRERGSMYGVYHLAFSPDGKALAVGFWEGAVAVYNIPSS